MTKPTIEGVSASVVWTAHFRSEGGVLNGNSYLVHLKREKGRWEVTAVTLVWAT
ncbi:MAG: hypothetical protein FJ363_04635 [Gemmatimonadetes bacterium]|nr:hypothetical protein [Gemmatimonadota bacterium]